MPRYSETSLSWNNLRELQERVNRLSNQILTTQEEMGVPNLRITDGTDYIGPNTHYQYIYPDNNKKEKLEKRCEQLVELETAVKELHSLIGETYKYTHKKKESALLAKIFECLNEKV